MTISKNFKKSFQILVIFALVISLFTPYATQKSNAAEVISVEKAIEINSGKATVRGYIVGYTKSKTNVVTTDFPDDNNFAIADLPNETDTTKMLFVQITTSYRSEFGLKSKPSNLGKQVEISGSLETYFSGPGLKSPTSMDFVKNTPDKVAAVTSTPEVGAVAVGTTVELATVTPDAKIYYTTDDSEPSSASTEYTAAIPVNEPITIKAIAVKDGLTNSEVSSFKYTIINENQVKEVKASPASGKVTAGTNVSLSTATDGATIHYTTDGSEPTVASSVYGEPIVINEDTTIIAIAVKDTLDPSTVSTFNYTIEVPPTAISIADARTQGTGEVIVKGIVTAKLKNTAHIQDETAAIAIHPVSSISANEGDEITVKGTLNVYNGLLQLQNATVVGNPIVKGVPTPVILTGAELKEENESKLATVNKVKITGAAQNYNATDANGTAFIVRDENSNLGLEAGTTYQAITGIVQEFNGAFQIIPRSVADIVLDTTALKEAVASPGAGTFTSAQNVTLSTTTAGAEIFYTLDGSNPDDTSKKYTTPITIDKATTLKAIVKAQDGTFSKVSTFEYKITDALRIHDIQGEAHYSPMLNQNVSDIEGIVTYVMGNRFFMQDLQPDDNPNTSEGILVNKSGHGVVAGDIVKVSGKVEEYYLEGYDDRAQTDLPLTQIYASTVTKIAKGELPAPVIIDGNRPNQVIDNDQFEQFDPEEDAIDYWESIEGMLVQVGNIKAIAPQEHGDLITLLENEGTNTLHGGLLFEAGKQNPHRIHFRMEPNGSARDFEVATGDKFNGPITGVVSYSYQNYKIIVPLNTMKDAHVKGTTKPEVTTIVKAEDKLTIASYNLENFSNNSAADETPQSKVDKLARAIGTDMGTPDIVGVTEVQDNNGTKAGGTAANQSYERLIAAIKARTGTEYKYLNIDPIDGQDGGAPNANIRVGFLYNPERVSIPAGLPSGDATTAVGYENGKLTLNPGRIDPNNEAFSNSRKPLAAQFIFKGEEVIVIANHWNSKSGDTPLFGQKQPPVYSSETKRKQIAQIVYNFVQDVKTKNPDANIVSLGDFNDYEFTDALKIHEGTLMTNMINKVVPASDRYTYVYQGNSQVLDHILVTNNLVNKTVIDILHINADFTDMAGRASDHDPVMVQIDLKASDETPIIEQKVFSINEFLTKKLTFTKPFVKVDLDGDSVIKDGVFFQGQFIELDGAGVAEHTVTINPNQPGAIVILKVPVQKLIIDGPNVKEIHGAENIKEIEYINGASPENIIFKNSEGTPIGDPSLLSKAPIVTLPISNKTVTEGEEISINLLDHFSDPNNDTLSFTATKGNVNGNTLTLSLSVGSHIVGVTATDGEYSVTTQFSVTVLEKGEHNEYYAIASGKTGTALRNALHEIISNQTILSYDQVWDALKITDEDPNNPNNVLLFYSGISRSKNLNGGNVGEWNREHVWAKSHGDFGTSKGPGTDIHHLRATDTQVNSSRGNLDFDYGGTSIKNCNLCKRDSDSFEPPDHVKGDVARMLFYMAIRYEQGDRVDLELNERVNNGKNPYHGKLSVLLEWHRKDPVDDIEKSRNEKIYKIQGNRNPFIDNPEWAMEIWN